MRATRKLERLFLNLSGKKDVASIGGSYYTLTVCDDITRYAWVLCLKHKSDPVGKFEEFISSVSDHGQVTKVRADEGSEFIGKAFKHVCFRHKIKHELITAESQKFNGVAERKLGIIEMASKAAQIQAPLLFPGAEIPTRDDLWAEGASWAGDSLNLGYNGQSRPNLSIRNVARSDPAVDNAPVFEAVFYRVKRRLKNQSRAVKWY